MDAEKIRNTTDAELRHQEHELSDQLFRLKFQMKMGQTESLQKIRGLRKDIARVKTVLRQRELGIGHNGSTAAPARQAPVPAAETKEKKQARAASTASKRTTGKTAAKKKTEKK